MDDKDFADELVLFVLLHNSSGVLIHVYDILEEDALRQALSLENNSPFLFPEGSWEVIDSFDVDDRWGRYCD